MQTSLSKYLDKSKNKYKFFFKKYKIENIKSKTQSSSLIAWIYVISSDYYKYCFQ